MPALDGDARAGGARLSVRGGRGEARLRFRAKVRRGRRLRFAQRAEVRSVGMRVEPQRRGVRAEPGRRLRGFARRSRPRRLARAVGDARGPEGDHLPRPVYVQSRDRDVRGFVPRLERRHTAARDHFRRIRRAGRARDQIRVPRIRRTRRRTAGTDGFDV